MSHTDRQIRRQLQTMTRLMRGVSVSAGTYKVGKDPIGTGY